MPDCREKLRREGKPYPRSSCAKCGSLIRPGWKCAEETQSLSEQENAAISQVDKMGSALRTALLALRDIAVLKAYHDKEDARRIAKDALNRMHGKLNG